MPTAADLSRLDPLSFEHLVNAIALKVLGAGATGFGPGPDAGRDGFFEGEANYPSDRQRWKGTWYIQSKFHAPHLSKDPQKWVIEQLKKELETFAAPGSDRKWPDNWIFATNVNPSGKASTGTFDQARKLVRAARPALATRFHFWGEQKLLGFLADNQQVARRFGHFLTPGHVLSALFDQLNDERASVEDIVRYSVVRGIEEQRQTRLEQAGSAEDRRPGIDALFVDLPFLDRRCDRGGMALETLSRAAALNHRDDEDDLSGDRWRRWRSQPERARVWFVRAGPGRGKSSIGQFFCQVQRAALILQPGGIAVHSDVRELARRIRAKAQEMGCWPTVPRIPLWVELKTYAAWFGQQDESAPKGIASFLSAVLYKDTETHVSVKTLRRALAERAWAIVFDGLDEVPSDVKDAVASEAVSFVRGLAPSADVLSICTSRPQGYAGQFDALDGAVVDLVDLPPHLALECATKLAVIDRSASEAQRAKEVLQRAIASPAVRELLTTPLQAHIMAVLVRNGQRPPERKWDLYHKFYEVIREREANRELPDMVLRNLFQRDPALIDTVHQRLGFALHARAERAKGADASLTKSEFRQLVAAVVREVRSAPEVEPIVDALVRATTERLVLISTPDQGDRVRFDIRAIQEFFAAEFLYVDTEVELLRERLELIAGDAHWREVVQFVLGALTALKRASEWLVALDVLRALDVGSADGGDAALNRRLARGALHAALFFENGSAESSRKTRDQLRAVLEPLSESTDESLLHLLRGVSSPESREWIRKWALEQARRLQPNQARGAYRTLAEHSSVSPEARAEILTFLDSLSSSLMGDMLLRRRARRHVHDRDGNEPTEEWERTAQDRLLGREDCLASAPEFVKRVLRESAERNGRTARRVRSAPSAVIAKMTCSQKLRRLFGPAQETAIGAVVIRENRLAAGVGPLLDGAEPGLLNWLRLLHQVSLNSRIEGVVQALSVMGTDWELIDVLPVELARAIPVPCDPRVSPLEIATAVAGLSHDEFVSQVAAGVLSGIPLRRPRRQIWSFYDGVWGDSDTIVSLAAHEPGVAWLIWCISQSNIKGPEYSGHVPNVSAMARRALVTAVVRDPFVVQFADRSFHLGVLPGIAALMEEQSVVYSALRSANVSWFLRFDRAAPVDAPVTEMTINLPEDASVLPLVASCRVSHLSWTLRTHTTDPYDATQVDQSKWQNMDSLLAVFGTMSIDSECRAAALLLAGLQPKGGWSVLLNADAELRQFARLGMPIAAGVALVIEMSGLWADPVARRILSELIAIGNPGSLSPGATDEDATLNLVLRIWRERSQAPMTKANAAMRWLDMPDS